MEGGDTWYFDGTTPVHEMFNINGTADGSSDMGTVVGNVGTFSEGMSFAYNGDNSFMDHIEPIAPANKIFDNQSPLYGTGVAYDDGDYKTIGTSHEFGGLEDSSSPSTKEELMSAYLNFLGISQTLQAYFSSNTTTLCIEDTIEFYDMSLGGATSWEWEFEGGSPATASSQNPIVAYLNPGIFDVSLTVFHGTTSSTFTIEDYITVNPVPLAPSAPTGPSIVCASEENTTYNTTGITGLSEYIWILEPSEAGSVTGTGLESTVFWEKEFMGNATLKVAAVNDCGTGDFSNPINISRYLPEVTLEPFEWVCVGWPAFELSGGTPEGGVYSGPGVENGWFDPANAGLGTHKITYTYTDPNSCENYAEETIVVDPCTGIDNLDEGQMRINPNPARDKVCIETCVDMEKVQLINQSGQMILEQKNRGKKTIIKTSYFESGIYFVKVFSHDNVITRKVVIE
nr:T9SS type A sorting domain-containing protein [Bacteroidota bacterium]